MKRVDITRWARSSAIVGGLAWLALFAAPLPVEDAIAPNVRLLLLAVLLIVPLALPLAAPTRAHAWATLAYRAALLLQPLAAALATIACFVPAGWTAALLAAAWLLPAGLVGLAGLLRLRSLRAPYSAELCIAAGLVYLPVGAAWLLLSRMGAHPLGFGDTVVILTAVHFHYAGFAAPILAGLAGRQAITAQPALRPLFGLVAAGVVAGVALVAMGITLARFTPLIELAAAVLFAASLLGLAALGLLVVAPAVGELLARVLLRVSAGSLVVTMLFAGSYTLGQFLGRPLVGIPRMVQVHGWLNAVGFVLCGLLAWSVKRKT